MTDMSCPCGKTDNCAEDGYCSEKCRTEYDGWNL